MFVHRAGCPLGAAGVAHLDRVSDISSCRSSVVGRALGSPESEDTIGDRGRSPYRNVYWQCNPGAITPGHPTHDPAVLAERLWTLHTERDEFRVFAVPMET
jgi:hypothetical protein